MDLKILVTGIQLENGGDTTSLLLVKAFFRSGRWAIRDSNYLSTIYGGKAGTTFYLLRISDTLAHAPGDELCDMMICLQLGEIKGMLAVSATDYLHLMKPEGVVVYDSTKSGVASHDRAEELHVKMLGVSALDIVGKTYPDETPKKANILRNSVLVGVALGTLGAKEMFPCYEKALAEEFGGKGKSLAAEKNSFLAKKGIEAYESLPTHEPYEILENFSVMVPQETRLLLRGNDAMFLAAQSLGRPVFYAGYPITPASDILLQNEKYNRPPYGVTLQTEDEIAALGAVLGASYGGAIAYTATSGPGFCLMMELLGHTSILEVPVLIINNQRAGPSTGMPTKTEQSDLNIALYGGNGDFPRIVLAPGDIDEHFYAVARGFYLAWKYRMPTIILSTLEIAEGYRTTHHFDIRKIKQYREFFSKLPIPEKGVPFHPYAITESGISPYTIPGVPWTVHGINGAEHNQDGRVTTERRWRVQIMDKRMRKLETCLRGDTQGPSCYGEKDAPIALIGWGATKGTLLEANKCLTEFGIHTKVIHHVDLMPFPSHATKLLLYKTERLFVVEENKGEQFTEYLRGKMAKMGLLLSDDNTTVITQYDGRPIEPRKIVSAVKEEVFHVQ